MYFCGKHFMTLQLMMLLSERNVRIRNQKRKSEKSLNGFNVKKNKIKPYQKVPNFSMEFVLAVCPLESVPQRVF